MSRRRRRAVLVLTAASAAVAAMAWSVPSRWTARREWKKGLAAAAAGDPAAAQAAFKSCLAARPSDEECAAVLELASRASDASDFDLSLKRLAALERQRSEAPRAPAPEKAAGYLKQGLEFAGRGEYEAALEAFRLCLALDPGNAACMAGGKLYAGRSGSEGAPAAAPAPATATEEDKRRAILHWNEGIKAFQKGNMSSARDEWLLCKKFDSENSDCSTGLARVDSAYGGGQ